MFEDRAADHGAESFTGKAETIHQAVQHGGEHVLVGGFGVGAVRPCERDAVATENGNPASILAVGGHVNLRFVVGSGRV